MVAIGNVDCKVGLKPEKQRQERLKVTDLIKRPIRFHSLLTIAQIRGTDEMGLAVPMGTWRLSSGSNGLCVLLQKVTGAILRG